MSLLFYSCEIPIQCVYQNYNQGSSWLHFIGYDDQMFPFHEFVKKIT